jgi:hypothetical protein
MFVLGDCPLSLFGFPCLFVLSLFCLLCLFSVDVALKTLFGSYIDFQVYSLIFFTCDFLMVLCVQHRLAEVRFIISPTMPNFHAFLLDLNPKLAILRYFRR